MSKEHRHGEKGSPIPRALSPRPIDDACHGDHRAAQVLGARAPLERVCDLRMDQSTKQNKRRAATDRLQARLKVYWERPSFFRTPKATCLRPQ